MQKFFVNNNHIIDNQIELTGSDVNHIVNVLRLRKDDDIQICDVDTGYNYIAKIIEYNNEKVVCNIIDRIESNSETVINIDLFQGLPKADKMELIIQKTIEIGVKSITPVEMERCVVKLDAKDKIKKIERWNKIAEGAAKQSKRDIIPQINNVINIKELYDKVSDYDLFIVAYEEEKQTSLKKILKENMAAKNIGVLIGPEGGIDIKEIEQIKNTDAKIVTLGSRILRTETAPIVITSNIIYELDD